MAAIMDLSQARRAARATSIIASNAAAHTAI